MLSRKAKAKPDMMRNRHDTSPGAATAWKLRPHNKKGTPNKVKAAKAKAM